MMKCKRHQYEQGAGVCATCLRDRLLALQDEQNGISPEHHHRNPPPPVLFPRSVSPYLSHRHESAAESAASDLCRRRPSYHSPQIADRRSDRRKSQGCRRFPLFSSLFHHHHHQLHHHRSDESEASASTSWFSSLIDGRRKKKTMMIKSESPPPPTRKMKSFAVSDRGMSPVRNVDADDCVSESGSLTESSATWRRPTPARRAAAERLRRHGGGLAGFTVCLSPLMRPGPTCSRNQPPPDLAFSGELNGNPMINRHVSGNISFGPNRSRKLADRSRFR